MEAAGASNPGGSKRVTVPGSFCCCDDFWPFPVSCGAGFGMGRAHCAPASWTRLAPAQALSDQLPNARPALNLLLPDASTPVPSYDVYPQFSLLPRRLILPISHRHFNVTHSMTYATAAPATSGGQGTNPVSCPFRSFSRCQRKISAPAFSYRYRYHYIDKNNSDNSSIS